MSLMKQWISPKLSSSRTLFHHGVILGLGLWLLAQIPVSVYFFNYFKHAEIQAQLTQQKALQSLLAGLFEQSARFGDLVNARVATLSFGSDFGLIDLGLCHGTNELLPRPFETRCKSSSAIRTSVRTASDTIELEFLWKSPTVATSWLLFRALSVSAFISLVLIVGVSLFLTKRLSLLVSRLGSQIAAASSLDHLTQLSSELSELKPIAVALGSAKKQLNESLDENIKLQTDAAIGQIASQVAHDIRSPLAALEVVASNPSQLPGELREITRSSIARIQDIANDLLRQSHRVKSATLIPGSETNADRLSIENVPILLESLIAEKKTQFAQSPNIRISLSKDPTYPDIYIRTNPSDFRRVISNLVNNSIEALPSDGGSVSLRVGAIEEFAEVLIQDDGKGIPAELLPRLGQKGATYNKSNGTGLGLFHARRTIESMGGVIEIDSEFGIGTKVILRIPLAEKHSYA